MEASIKHEAAPDRSSGQVLRRFLRMREFALIVMIVAVGVILQIATQGRFFTTANFNAITLGFATSAIIMVGMTAALVSGGFDLSVGSVFAMGGVVAALAMRSNLPIPLAILLGLGAGMLSGAFTGILITQIKINPFISTLGMLGIARGIALALTQGSPVASLPEEFALLGQGRLGDLIPALHETALDIPNLVWIALVIVIIGDILMRRSAPFRSIYYVGGNEEAARLSGINVNRVLLGVYILCGSLAALAGVLSVSRFTVADPGAGSGEELRIIAACIIGGCSLKGGKGAVIGGLLGLIFVGFINNGMVLLRVPVYWQSLVTGVILLLAVGFDTMSQRLQQ
ncbi:MAG: ABC transporter permease, partial [Anaerolinea sp.]|nr:ABC transporter permease [Anaerolinea sp.]